jgi:hypothetical protein
MAESLHGRDGVLGQGQQGTLMARAIGTPVALFADGDALVIGHHRIGYINTARTQGQVFNTPGFDAPSFGWVASTVR